MTHTVVKLIVLVVFLILLFAGCYGSDIKDAVYSNFNGLLAAQDAQYRETLAKYNRETDFKQDWQEQLEKYRSLCFTLDDKKQVWVKPSDQSFEDWRKNVANGIKYSSLNQLIADYRPQNYYEILNELRWIEYSELQVSRLNDRLVTLTDLVATWKTSYSDWIIKHYGGEVWLVYGWGLGFVGNKNSAGNWYYYDSKVLLEPADIYARSLQETLSEKVDFESSKQNWHRSDNSYTGNSTQSIAAHPTVLYYASPGGYYDYRDIDPSVQIDELKVYGSKYIYEEIYRHMDRTAVLGN